MLEGKPADFTKFKRQISASMRRRLLSGAPLVETATGVLLAVDGRLIVPLSESRSSAGGAREFLRPAALGDEASNERR